MVLSLAATGADFPTSSVQKVLERHQITFEARHLSQADKAEVKYSVLVDPDLALDRVSEEIRSESRGDIRSVGWERAKKRE